MILGMSIAAFTTLHVVISLIGIATGFIVAFGMISARRLPAMNAVFLATTALTSLTGFLFPFKGVTPGIVIGILSILILIVAVVALYSKRLSGRLARDLCDHRHAGPVFQFFCAHRAVV